MTNGEKKHIYADTGQAISALTLILYIVVVSLIPFVVMKLLILCVDSECIIRMVNHCGKSQYVSDKYIKDEAVEDFVSCSSIVLCLPFYCVGANK